jgi:FtsP/CotA-like multicopper oxidase with cupredoxin domain
MVVRGLHARTASASAPDTLRLAPGESRTIRFRLDAPGTYYYWATSDGRTLDYRTGADAQLSGAIVVDRGDAPAPHDRVLVLGIWSDTTGRFHAKQKRLLAVVNGLSWPHTERFAYTVGDTVRWRIVNPSADPHPMHLHGFYFALDSRGNGASDVVFDAQHRLRENTELMLIGSTMSMTWVPERPGNWLFHCHIPEHFASRGPLGIAHEQKATSSADHDHASMRMTPQMTPNHALSGMSGLVVGVEVRPRRARLASASRARGVDERDRRHLRLLVRPNAGGTEAKPLYGFALHERGSEPAQDSGLHIGPPIVLTRGQPVSITVVNRLAAPTAVHWHGIELESYYDGVAGFSGSGTTLAPIIAPGDSFEARFTPPRAGTFIYHTHVDEVRQQVAGLAGPIIVLEPGQSYDPSTDISVLITSPADSATDLLAVLLNGSLAPSPLDLRIGVTYRLRFINITTGRPGLGVELFTSSALGEWRRLAKDGLDLPQSQRVLGPARQPISIGETFDAEITPREAGVMRLEFRAPGGLFGTLPVRVH